MGDPVRTELRALVWTRDGASLVELLGVRPWPADSLQLIGDGLLAAVEDGVGGAAALARDCVNALQERGWFGDGELAEALVAALGDGPAPALRALPVDLDQLADVLEGDPVEGGGRLDLSNGQVWPELAFADSEMDGDSDPERWLWVDSEGSHAGYRDMELFIERLQEERVAGRLERAISGPRPFRRFKDALAGEPELFTQWHEFSDDRHRGRARRWLADAGYTPKQSRMP
jgi:hypothetical protein